MNQTLVNGELSVAYPDGFRVMDSDELKRVFGDNIIERWAIWDEERHIIFAVAWHRSNAFVVKLASAKELARRIEKAARKSYKATGSYGGGKLFKTTICGQDTWGTSFSYEMQGIAHVGEVLAAKHGACVYNIHAYMRANMQEESRNVLDKMYASMSFA